MGTGAARDVLVNDLGLDFTIDIDYRVDGDDPVQVITDRGPCPGGPADLDATGWSRSSVR